MTHPTPKSDSELLPCPFCGSLASLQCHGGVFPEAGHRVECEGACHAMTCYWHTREQAVATWNRRAPAAGPRSPSVSQDAPSPLPSPTPEGLVAKLLARANRLRRQLGNSLYYGDGDAALDREAASRIEALEGERDEAIKAAADFDKRIATLLKQGEQRMEDSAEYQISEHLRREANARLQSAEAALSASQSVVGEMRKGLEEIANESAFNLLRYAGEDDTDYFLRCFRSVKDRVRHLLSLHPEGGRS